jgi:hypothetical protein
MSPRRLRWAVAVAVASCAVVFVAATSPLAPAEPVRSGALHGARRSAPPGGVNIGEIEANTTPSEIDAEIASAKRLHAQLVRAVLPWAQFEPHRPGELDSGAVSAAARLMHDAAAAHIQVIASVFDTPCWASSAPSSMLGSCNSFHSGAGSAWPPRDPSDFATFVGWLASAYGPRLAAIEVWNEPDQQNEDYFAGPEKPRHYAELLKAAYPAVKQADAKVKVLAGSLVGSNGAFMEALYRNGIKGFYDGVAVHFYTLVLGSVRRFREVQLAHGDHTPLWLDEFGWTSCWPQEALQEEQGCVTAKVQAQNLRSAFAELDEAPYLAAVVPYELRDSPGGQFGVLNEAGARKPSFGALAGALARPGGAPPPPTLRLRASDGRVIASGFGPVGDYMKIEAFRSGRLRYEAVFTLNRFNRYRLALPKALGASDLTIRVYQYWLGPDVDDAVRRI